MGSAGDLSRRASAATSARPGTPPPRLLRPTRCCPRRRVHPRGDAGARDEQLDDRPVHQNPYVDPTVGVLAHGYDLPTAERAVAPARSVPVERHLTGACVVADDGASVPVASVSSLTHARPPVPTRMPFSRSRCAPARASTDCSSSRSCIPCPHKDTVAFRQGDRCVEVRPVVHPAECFATNRSPTSSPTAMPRGSAGPATTPTSPGATDRRQGPGGGHSHPSPTH